VGHLLSMGFRVVRFRMVYGYLPTHLLCGCAFEYFLGVMLKQTKRLSLECEMITFNANALVSITMNHKYSHRDNCYSSQNGKVFWTRVSAGEERSSKKNGRPEVLHCEKVVVG
jgi:hypothetical protein